MPKKRVPWKKKTYKRYGKPLRKMGKLQVSRGLRQSVHFFKRRTLSFVKNDQNFFTRTQDGGLVRTFHIAFNMLEGSGDFTPLYKMYKIHAVKMKITTSVQTALNNTGASSQPSACIVRWTYNRTGDTIDSLNTISQWLQQSATKQRSIPTRKPLILYCKPRVANQVYNSAVAGYSTMRPQYFSTENAIGTNQVSIPHYCFDIRIDRVDGTPFPLPADMGEADLPFMSVETTVYMSCKGVK